MITACPQVHYSIAVVARLPILLADEVQSLLKLWIIWAFGSRMETIGATRAGFCVAFRTCDSVCIRFDVIWGNECETSFIAAVFPLLRSILHDGQVKGSAFIGIHVLRNQIQWEKSFATSRWVESFVFG